TLVNGQATFSVTYKTAGKFTTTASDIGNGAVKGAAPAITVNAGATVGFSVVGLKDLTKKNVAQAVALAAVDAFGNVAATYVGTVNLSGAGATFPASVSITAANRGKK